jgi:glucose/mannose-6-phosphate isomerase
MGGSAIVGDLVADLASVQETVPVVVVRDFKLPFAPDERSLVILCSYSGNTEETLSMFHQAIRANTQVMVVTAGGLLAHEARVRRIPCLKVQAAGEPRSAVGYNLFLLLGLLHRLGLMVASTEDVQAAIQALGRQVSRMRHDVPTRENPAKTLALELKGRLILVYGGGIFSGVARRWKTQLNENAKVWAFSETIPEVLHNSVEAYAAPPAGGAPTAVLLLQPSPAVGPLAGCYRTLCQLLRESGISRHLLTGMDGPPLTQLLGMLLFGDYVSYYLALLQGVDPSPNPTITQAKERLAQRHYVVEEERRSN